MPSHILNDTELSSQSIFLHSNDSAISISDAEKIFYLKQSITAPAGYRLLIGLTNLTLPNSMYNITEGNNIIEISVDDVSTKYTIEAGNYSATDLESELNTAISSIGSVTFDPIDNLFSFSFNDPSIIESTSMERQLGLKGQLPLPGATTSYQAQNICDLGGVTNIYIRIRNLTINNLDSRGNNSNIIASIANNTNYGGYMFYFPPEILYYQIYENNISHLDIELTDQEGVVLDLNGADFNLTLTVHYVKQRESSFKNTLLKEIKERHSKNREEEKKNDE